MGKKGNRRKTRWRVLPIGGEEGDYGCSANEDEGEPERGSGSPTSHSSGSYARVTQHPQQRPAGRSPRPRPGYYRHRSYHDSKQPLVTTEKKTFNEEEYTKITTPRQDVLFKKGYLGRKKPVVPANPPTSDPSGAAGPEDHTMHNGGPLESEHQLQAIDRVELLSPVEEQHQIVYTNGYMDQSVYYINGSSYELYDPYTGNVTTVVVGPAPHYAGPSGGPPVLAAVPCQPLPLQPLEWFNPAYLPPQYVGAPACPRDRRKRPSTDSQNCSPQSSESTDPPGSPQDCEEVVGLHNGEECTVYSNQHQHQHQHATYVYPGYMFGPPVYSVNGITVQGVPPQPQSADFSGSKRRKKKRRRRRRRGGVDDGSEESSSDEKELEEPASVTSHESSQELESDSKQSAESGSKDELAEEKGNSLESSKVISENGEANNVNKYNCTAVNGTIIKSDISVKSELNGYVEDIPTSNSELFNNSNDKKHESVGANISNQCEVIHGKEETNDLINESLNSSTTNELVLKSNQANITNAVHNTECKNTSQTGKPSLVSPKPTSNKDVIFLANDHKNAKGDTHSAITKEKVKSKKGAKVSKQKQQQQPIVSNGYGELQVVDVQLQSTAANMDGNEIASGIPLGDECADIDQSEGKLPTKSELPSTYQRTEEEISSLLPNTNLNTGQTRSIEHKHVETPKKALLQGQSVQQQKKLSKEDLVKVESSNPQMSTKKNNPKKQSGPHTSVSENIVLQPSREKHLEENTPNAYEGTSSLSKTISKSIKSGNSKSATALSVTSLPKPETKHDSITSDGSYKDSTKKSSLGEVSPSQNENKTHKYQDTMFLTSNISDVQSPTTQGTSSKSSDIIVQSSLSDSSAVCTNQERKPDKNMSSKHVNPFLARIGHSPELQKQLSKTYPKQSKLGSERSSPPPIPPPRRKKWQSSNKRTSLERPPTPGRELESSRSSEILSDESCSSSTSQESEESVIELLSPTSSPDSKGMNRSKELSSEDEEGVIFGSKDTSESSSTTVIEHTIEHPNNHKNKLDTLYESNITDRTKTGPDKEEISTTSRHSFSNVCCSSSKGPDNLSLNKDILTKDTVRISQYSSAGDKPLSNQRFQTELQDERMNNKCNLSLTAVEKFANTMSQRLLCEALSDELLREHSSMPHLSALPITEAVTRWLHSQPSEEVLCLPHNEDMESDWNDEDGDTGVEADGNGEKSTGQKNVLRNPLPASSHKCANIVHDHSGRRVASYENKDFVKNSNTEAYHVRRLFEGNSDQTISNYDFNINVDHSIPKIPLVKLADTHQPEKYINSGSSENHAINKNYSNNKTDNCTTTQKSLKEFDLNDCNPRELQSDTNIEQSERIGTEENSSSFTSGSAEYDGEWECELLAPSVLNYNNNNDDSNISVGSADDRCSHMCDPTVSVAKYYRLGTPAEKIATIVQELESSSGTETDEEVDALEHFKNELNRREKSEAVTLAEELMCSQEPIPESWSIDPVKMVDSIRENKTLHGNPEIYKCRYGDYRASDSGIHSEDSGNESFRKAGTHSPNPLSHTASVLHRKSAILLSQFSSDSPGPCGGICCILQ